jgi:hypothetical protein
MSEDGVIDRLRQAHLPHRLFQVSKSYSLSRARMAALTRGKAIFNAFNVHNTLDVWI